MSLNKALFVASLICFIVALIGAGDIPWTGLGFVFLSAGFVA